MKYHFLLDENVLHHAVKGVDAQNNTDFTAAQLVLLIGQNCHRIVVNGFLHGRYLAHIKDLEASKSGVLQPLFFLKELIRNSAKVVWEHQDPPQLPNCPGIPREDADMVRAALVSRPVFVTAEANLKSAINECEALHLRAVDPAEAIPLARET